jgi:hypothetical protein
MAPKPSPGSAADPPGTILYSWSPETPSGDNQCVGVEFDGTYYYVTGAGGTAGVNPNLVHCFDSVGTYLGNVSQGTTSTWGWRDIAYDGNHMFSSDSTQVDEWFITGLPGAPVMNYVASHPGPGINPCRAMAYDPATGHFWTASWSSPIYEFDLTGFVYNSYAHTLGGIYGMAWDDFCPGGPFLWVYSQDGTPARLVSQFSPATGTFTGVTYTGFGPTAGGMAGGAAFYVSGTMGIFVGLTQDSPDTVFGMEICNITAVPNVWITVAPTGTTIIPPTGGVLGYNIAAGNNENFAVTADIWADVTLPNGQLYGPILGPVLGFNLPAGWSGNRNRNLNVPAGAPPGNYFLNGYIGIYGTPPTIWAQSSFPWIKQ